MTTDLKYIFSLRRAKAKLQDGKRGRTEGIFGAGGIGSMGVGIGGGDWVDLLPPVDAPPPQLSPDHEAELRRLIHEEGRTYFPPRTFHSLSALGSEFIY